ncbi:ABC transporter substrate-binding protein [Magnetospira sp. QH-2]|uniref:ABC transporter substrate-binding protein n=1 Tax=Magnetospira sp. (strain QH-2) TaxID=1288970 RepID=UPI0003E81882|nr:ABC transporter substrate-binding protein [Magnetospira sp. QH-2]CCQ74917.1 putative oligopeptide ABC transporter, periplasmic oligopeptide-binding protein [Magnetospira sp. QH-2]
MMRLGSLLALSLIVLATPARALVETPMLVEPVAAGTMPPVGERLPSVPSVVKLTGDDQPGRHGGTLRTLMGRAKDTRMMVVYGYARLVGYDTDFDIKPDLLEKVDVADGRVFTFHLRPGHKWSDGHPFTSEDFRYWWEDIANNPEMSPNGPPQMLAVDGQPPRVEFLDETTVRYSWDKPNPRFLSMLAGARPLYLFAPAHYLKSFHKKYQKPDALEQLVKNEKQRNWVALQFRMGRMYKTSNPDLPTLQPWVLRTKPPSDRFIFERNPFYHRIDEAGRQLPYIDRVIMSISDKKLIPAKVGAGDVDLQARYLSFNNYTFLKQGEKRNGYRVLLWRRTNGSQVALYPNLNTKDPVWRELMRQSDFRRALSMAIDRHEINQVIYYGLALEICDNTLPQSPLYHEDCATAWAQFDMDTANKMLDGLGLTERDDRGIRLLSNGQPLEIVVETAGESVEQTDVLSLIGDSWQKVGVKLYPKPLQRELLRNRVFSGATTMSVWWGLDNALVTPDMAPNELAPVNQNKLIWPKWGQYFETKGHAGEPIDYAPAAELMDLYNQWIVSKTTEERHKIWRRMLDLYASEALTIGTVAGVFQPVVVSDKLRNVPQEATYGWDPGAHLGIHRPDTFWFTDTGEGGQ